MGRELKRVPIDFDYPIGKIWYGYYMSFCSDDNCETCKLFAKIKGLEIHSYGCPDFEPLNGPPTGDGYQLWETTTEGSPISPVFVTLDELCEWCEENATTFSTNRATKKQWKQMLDSNFVFHKQDNTIFI